MQAGGQEMEVDHGLRWLPPSMSVIRREQEQKKAPAPLPLMMTVMRKMAEPRGDLI